MSRPQSAAPIRMLLLIDDLRLGGAQRVLAALANRWAASGSVVDVATFADPSEDFYPLDGPRRTGLGLPGPAGSSARALRMNVQRVRRIRDIIARTEPDVVVSFMDRMNVLAVVASVGQSVPVVVSEHTNPRRHYVHPLVRPARRLAYLRAAAVVVQTETVRRWAAAWGRRDRIYVLPNPIPAGFEPRTRAPAAQSELVIGGVGRLSPEKGFDLLIEAFAAIASAAPGARLVIHGEGPERPRLEQLTHDLGVAGRVDLPGAAPMTSEALRGLDIFVLCSEYEGFSIALLEALAVGVPALAFAGLGGVDDMIEPGVNGMLVPAGDVAALAGAIVELLQDESLRARLGANAAMTRKRFDLDTVGAQWDRVLAVVAARRRGDRTID